MTNFIPSTDKLEVFEAILKARKSSYALKDKGLLSEDSVVGQEENADNFSNFMENLKKNLL